VNGRAAARSGEWAQHFCKRFLLLLCGQLFVIDNCIDDWRIAVSCRTFFQIAVELIVCVIHPPPLGSHYFVWRTVHADGETVTSPQVSDVAELAIADL